jgi:hypothetical protein
MNNVKELTAKFDDLLKYQHKTMKTMDRLLLMAEQLLHDVNQYNKGVGIQ